MSDKTTTIQQLKNKLKKFQRERGWNPKSRDLAISIAIEAAELLEHFQWDDFFKNRGKNKKEMEYELADVIVYCLEFASAEEIDVSKTVEEKIRLNTKKYPVKLVKAVDYYELKRRSRARLPAPVNKSRHRFRS